MQITKFKRSNRYSKPKRPNNIVSAGEQVKGRVLADGLQTSDGEISLGKTLNRFYDMGRLL